MPRSSFIPGLGDPEWAPIEAELLRRGVSAALRSELRSKLEGRYDGLLLYGSWARGDADEDSDLDALVANFNGVLPETAGRVSIGHYSLPELEEVSGTLFGFHLVRDGVVLFDRDGALSQSLSSIQPPAPGSVIARVRSLTPVLDITYADRQRYIEGLTKVARYLLRSALYAEALDQGEPCFSIREIAMRKNDPSLTSVLSSHRSVRPPASDDVLDDLLSRLTVLLGPLMRNLHEDLHGLIEETWDTDRDLSNFATLALSDGTDDLPYDELPRITL